MKVSRSGFVQVDYRSPEWLVIKGKLEEEKAVCINKLVSTGLSEAEYNQWRGRAHLINKLLDEESRAMSVTD